MVSAGASKLELYACGMPNTCLKVTGARTLGLSAPMMEKTVAKLSPGCSVHVTRKNVVMTCAKSIYVVSAGKPTQQDPFPELDSLLAREKRDILNLFCIGGKISCPSNPF